MLGAKKRSVAGLLLLALISVACGSGSPDGTSVTTGPSTTTTSTTTAPVAEVSGFPVTVEAANGAITIDLEPIAIISLSPTATEMLFAVGAGDQVVAVDEYSYYPAEAPVTDLSGYTPNVEAIAALEPDLVVLADDMAGVISGLAAIGIPVIQLPAAVDVDEVYVQIETIGLATGHTDEAADLVESMKKKIAEIVASAPLETVTFFHEVDSTLYSASSATFIGSLYQLLGLTNIADAVDTAESFGYPQLSAEYVIQADPEVMFLADAAYGESAETVAARPGWAEISAVKAGRVFPIDADISSRWGPRIVDFLQVVVDAVATVTKT